MIRIVNLSNYVPRDGETLIVVDRTTALGNPFHMTDESQRDSVCDEYQEYFYNKVHIKHPNFMAALKKIYSASLMEDVALGCWCYPLRCHSETIKGYIDSLTN